MILFQTVCELTCPCMKDKECVNVTLRRAICEITTLDLYRAKLIHMQRPTERLTVKIRVQNIRNVQGFTGSENQTTLRQQIYPFQRMYEN